MSRGNQVFVLLFLAIAALTLIRLLLPFDIPDARNVLPEVYTPKKEDYAKQYLTDILAHNLWDEKRAALTAIYERSESDQATTEGSQGEMQQGQTISSLKLVGVSRGDVEFFAVIESTEGIEHYAPGAMLPDGSRLEEVLEYGIQISKSGKNEQLYLFGKK